MIDEYPLKMILMIRNFHPLFLLFSIKDEEYQNVSYTGIIFFNSILFPTYIFAANRL